jgi:hypothetical protein
MDDGSIRSYTCLHNELRRKFVKPSGPCWGCGELKPLEWALRPDRETYSKLLEAYVPVCHRCHFRWDHGYKLTTVLGHKGP